MVTKLNTLGRFLVMLICLLVGVSAMAQERTVTGTIKGDDGEALVGASVVVKGTTKGTITDIDGKYSISSPADATLVVSYVGYQSQEIAVGKESMIDVSLSTSTLNEVVVTGYSTQSRRDITGSVAIVDTKDMKKLAASNFAEQLQGKVAGVQISSSGDPGSSVMVRIRGYGTINNNEPLYVIDGVPVQNESNLNFLNPNDIESMQVLKDAASASVYGSRAANGVVIITTKKGKLGASKISFDMFTGTQTPTKFPDLQNPTQLLQTEQGFAAGQGLAFNSSLYLKNGDTWVLPDFIMRGSEASGAGSGGRKTGDPQVDPKKYFLNPDPNGSASVNYLIQQANKTGTDWFRTIFNTAPLTSYQLSASGGSPDGSNYFISGNVYDHQGILVNNNYKRYQARANTQFVVKKNVRVGEHLNFAYQTTTASIGNPNEGSSFLNALRMPQIVPTADIIGNPSGAFGTNSNAGNPLLQQQQAVTNPGYGTRVFGDVFAEVDLFKYFTFKTSFGLDYGTGRQKNFGFRTYQNTEVNASNSLFESQYSNINWNWFNTLRFSHTLTPDIKMDALVGTEAKRNYYVGFNASGTSLDFNDPSYRILDNVTAGRKIGGYEGTTTKSSIIGSANFSFFDKYLLSATIRRDGSSKFLNNRYGVFPGVSVGWRLSNEEFLKDISAISDLKLRVGYGVTGNDEASNNFPGFSNFGPSIGTASYSINGSPNSVATGFQQNSVGNPDLKWETTTMTNTGFDMTLFKNFDVIFEYYTKLTKDMIFPVNLPTTQSTNIGAKNLNIGDMKNTGIDLQLNYRGKINKDLNYTVGVTASHYKNEVTRLDANDNTFVQGGFGRIDPFTRTTIGQPLSSFYGYQVDGLWQSDAEIKSVLKKAVGEAKVGRFKFRDLNGDGQINEKDETFIGSPHPKLIYGLNLGLSYKSFDFTFFLQGQSGNKIMNYVKYFTDFPTFQANRSVIMLTEAGKSYPKLDGSDTYSAHRSSFYVEDGSYLRGRNLLLGYTLPTSLLSKAKIERLRIYVQAQNLFTITKYTGLDPDVSVANITEGFREQRDLTLGVDYGHYPTARSLIFGVNLDF